jgi:hypothetical protein
VYGQKQQDEVVENVDGAPAERVFAKIDAVSVHDGWIPGFVKGHALQHHGEDGREPLNSDEDSKDPQPPLERLLRENGAVQREHAALDEHQGRGVEGLAHDGELRGVGELGFVRLGLGPGGKGGRLLLLAYDGEKARIRDEDEMSA